MVRISNMELLKILIENARTPFVKIAERLGVSETAVRKKIKRLEESGIIKKYTIVADPKKIGYEIDAIIGIDTTPERYIDVTSRLRNNPEIISLCSTAGDHMIMFEIWLKNSIELEKFIRELESMEGVTKVCPAIVMDKIK